MSKYRMAKVVSIVSQFRMNYPWAYTLSCGHVFRGQKSKPTPISGDRYPKHPTIMRCRECYP